MVASLPLISSQISNEHERQFYLLRRSKKEKKRLKKKQKKKPPVTIRTTEGGVPRIIAGNFRGLGYGYGFSLAKHNICSMAEMALP